MSENALKRVAISMTSCDGPPLFSQRLSAKAVHHRLRKCFPNHHYNLMSVKLYLLRLYDLNQVAAYPCDDGLLDYELTELGCKFANTHWASRGKLGYQDPETDRLVEQQRTSGMRPNTPQGIGASPAIDIII